MEGVSKKGDKYYYLYVAELEKKVFLEPVEVKLLRTLGLIPKTTEVIK